MRPTPRADSAFGRSLEHGERIVPQRITDLFIRLVHIVVAPDLAAFTHRVTPSPVSGARLSSVNGWVRSNLRAQRLSSRVSEIADLYDGVLQIRDGSDATDRRCNHEHKHVRLRDQQDCQQIGELCSRGDFPDH